MICQDPDAPCSQGMTKRLCCKFISSVWRGVIWMGHLSLRPLPPLCWTVAPIGTGAAAFPGAASGLSLLSAWGSKSQLPLSTGMITSEKNKILCFETWALRYLKMWTGILGGFLTCRHLYLLLTSNSAFEQAALPVITDGQVPLNLSEPFSVWNDIWVKMRNLASHLGLADAWSPGRAPAGLLHVQRSWVDGLLPSRIPNAFSIYSILWPSL